jgi:hypothetical protein
MGQSLPLIKITSIIQMTHIIVAMDQTILSKLEKVLQIHTEEQIDKPDLMPLREGVRRKEENLILIRSQEVPQKIRMNSV